MNVITGNKKCFLNQRGFSLIELMVVIGIVGILLAISGGAYSSWKVNARVDGAKEKIVSVLQQTRLTALSQGTTQTTTFNYAGAPASPNTLVDVRGQTHAFQNVKLEDFVCGTCTLGVNNTDVINFQSGGTATTLTVRVSSPGSAKMFYVLVNPVTGRVDVRRTCNAGACL